MRTPPLPSAGDLFRAEVSGEYVVGKVLWCSHLREHRGSGGFVVLPGVHANPADVVVADGDYVPATESVLVVHTSLRLLRKRGWPVVGHRALTARDEELLLNRRGSSLHRGEEHVRQLSEQEQGSFLPWLAAGPGAVDFFLRRIVERQRPAGTAP